MQFEISDQAAIGFGQAFYSALADGVGVEAAVTEARQHLRERESLEWGTPVLYLSASSGALFTLDAPIQKPPQASEKLADWRTKVAARHSVEQAIAATESELKAALAPPDAPATANPAQ